MTDAERKWREAHEAVCEAPDYVIWPRCEGWHGACESAHAAIDAAVRAALEEMRDSILLRVLADSKHRASPGSAAEHFADIIKDWRLPLWLPAGEKEDK